MWCKENVLRLINLIESHRCLWDATDENRRKKGRIAEAHKAIANEMGFAVDEIKKKINNLRSQMNGERTKVAKGGKSGAGGSETYVPRWEFYNSLQFIYKGENISDGTSDSFGELNEDSNSSVRTLTEEEFSDMIEVDPMQENIEVTPGSGVSGTSTPTSQSSKKRKAKQTSEDFVLQQCIRTMTASPPPPCPKIKPRLKALVDSVTALLSEMEVEDSSLGLEFTTDLRNLLYSYEIRFDRRKLKEMDKGNTSYNVDEMN